MRHKKATLLIKIRSTLLWTIMTICVPFYSIFIFSLFFLNVKARHKVAIQWNQLFAFLSRYLCGIKYIVYGRENILTTPAIIASNHQSMWETFMFCLVLPQHVWVLKKEILNIPFFGWAARFVSPIAIDRSNRTETLQQVLQQAAIRVAKGFWIIIFPEGTRSHPGEDRPFKSGVGKLAAELKLPVLPVAHDAGHVLPKRSFWLYPGTVTIIIDKPLYMQSDETPQEFTERIRTVIADNLKVIKMNEV